MLYNTCYITHVNRMLYNTCYITFEELLYNIQVWLYNIQDGYITHPNLPHGTKWIMVAGGPCRCPYSSMKDGDCLF